MSYSEFLNAIDVTQGNPHLKSQIFFKESERPFVYQIYDDSPERFLLAASRLIELRPDIIDMNLGCSAKNVSNRGAGAGLLKTPLKIAQIAHILEDSGISLIAVHGRTRRQEYSGQADWQAIAEVKQAVKIPVVGNGDILSYADGLRMMKQTGCDDVMIGRAAIGNPWIFANSDREKTEPAEKLRVITLHLQEMVELYGEKIAVLVFRKHLLKYMSGYLTTPEIRRSIFSHLDAASVLAEAAALLQCN
jgi:tRNA-dihydrouridine synthase